MAVPVTKTAHRLCRAARGLQACESGFPRCALWARVAAMNAPMTLPALSDDQSQAWDRVSHALEAAGIDLDTGQTGPMPEGRGTVLAITGKAGVGQDAAFGGADQGAGGRRGRDRSLASMNPASAATAVRWPCWPPPTRRPLSCAGAVCLRPPCTAFFIPRSMTPEYEKIAEWLAGQASRPTVEGLDEAALDRAANFYAQTPSIPGALAAAGLRGSDFITGWKRRDDPLDIGFVDESSMLDARQLDDLKRAVRHSGAVWRSGAACPGGRRWRHGFRPFAKPAENCTLRASTGRLPTTRSWIWPMRWPIPTVV